MDLFDLVAKITLDSSGYEGALENASGETSSFADKLQTGLSTAAKVGAAALTAVTAATVAFTKGLVDGIAQTAAYGDNVDKMSQKMGISAEAYQEWDAIMQHSGASIDSMQRGMTTLSKAAENGSDAFQKLGLTQEQVASMNQEELFAATIAGLQGMEEGTERTVLAQELLGGSAKELGALLNTSAEDTEAMRKRVHELGGVMSDEAVKAAAAYQDSLQDMQTAFSGLSRGLLTEFMPSITTVMDGLTEIFSGNSEAGIAMISEGVETVVNTISDKLPEFLELGTEILDALVQALINNLPKLLESGGEMVGKLIAGLISAIPKIIAMAPQIIAGVVRGLVSAWPEIRNAGIELIDQIGDGIASAISSAWTWGRDLIDNFIDGILGAARNLWNTLTNIGQGIRNFLGFSEPKEGPLSNFHTYAPDMMKLFAQGIKDNEHLVTDQIAKSFNFESTITPNIKGSVSGFGGDGRDDEVINIVVQSVLDGRVIGETAYKYERNRARAAG